VPGSSRQAQTEGTENVHIKARYHHTILLDPVIITLQHDSATQQQPGAKKLVESCASFATQEM
jgi:hypothetical protein